MCENNFIFVRTNIDYIVVHACGKGSSICARMVRQVRKWNILTYDETNDREALIQVKVKNFE